MFVLGICHIPFHWTAINVPLYLFSILLYSFSLVRIKMNKHPGISFSKNPGRLAGASIVFAAFIVISSIGVFWAAFNIPILEWDAFSTHAFNAKVFFYEKTFAYLNSQPHANYPLHIPLMQAWLSTAFGSWNDQVIKTLFPFYFLSLLIIQYHFLIRHTTQPWSLLGLVLTISSPFLIYHATIGYRDFTLLFFNISAILLLLLWQEEKSGIYLISSSLFSGLSSFTKLEGGGYLLIHIILLTAILSRSQAPLREKSKSFLRFCIPAVGIFLLFHIYKYFSSGVSAALPPQAQESLDIYSLRIDLSGKLLARFGIVVNRFLYNLFLTNNWNIIWLMLLFSLLKIKKKACSFEVKLLFLALLLFFSIYLAGYVLTQHYYWVAETETVLSRSLLHFFPLAPILVILINFPGDETPRRPH